MKKKNKPRQTKPSRACAARPARDARQRSFSQSVSGPWEAASFAPRARVIMCYSVVWSEIDWRMSRVGDFFLFQNRAFVVDGKIFFGWSLGNFSKKFEPIETSSPCRVLNRRWKNPFFFFSTFLKELALCPPFFCFVLRKTGTLHRWNAFFFILPLNRQIFWIKDRTIVIMVLGNNVLFAMRPASIAKRMINAYYLSLSNIRVVRVDAFWCGWLSGARGRTISLRPLNNPELLIVGIIFYFFVFITNGWYDKVWFDSSVSKKIILWRLEIF